MATTETKTRAQELQERLLEIQLERETLSLAEAHERLAAKKQLENEAKGARLIGITALMQQKTQEDANRASCAHIKPSGKSAAAGQWDAHGDFHWICAYCAQEWTNGELPVRLHVDSSLVGGPNRI